MIVHVEVVFDLYTHAGMCDAAVDGETVSCVHLKVEVDFLLHFSKGWSLLYLAAHCTDTHDRKQNLIELKSLASDY